MATPAYFSLAKKTEDTPPHTIVFSSTHIDAQGNLLNQPAATETLGNTFRRSPRVGFTGLDFDGTFNRRQQRSRIFRDNQALRRLDAFQGERIYCPRPVICPDRLRRDKDFGAFLRAQGGPSLRRNFISDELTLSEDSSVTDLRQLQKKLLRTQGLRMMRLKIKLRKLLTKRCSHANPLARRGEKSWRFGKD